MLCVAGNFNILTEKFIASQNSPDEVTARGGGQEGAGRSQGNALWGREARARNDPRPSEELVESNPLERKFKPNIWIWDFFLSDWDDAW